MTKKLFFIYLISHSLILRAMNGAPTVRQALQTSINEVFKTNSIDSIKNFFEDFKKLKLTNDDFTFLSSYVTQKTAEKKAVLMPSNDLQTIEQKNKLDVLKSMIVGYLEEHRKK